MHAAALSTPHLPPSLRAHRHALSAELCARAPQRHSCNARNVARSTFKTSLERARPQEALTERIPPLDEASYAGNLAAAVPSLDAAAAAAAPAPRSRHSWGPGTAAQPLYGTPSMAAQTPSEPAWHRHEMFYAVLQALMYVLCYHLPSACADAPQGPLAVLTRDAVVPLLRSPLAPLATCLPSVSAEFVRQLAAHRLADVAHLLPRGGAAADASGRRFEMLFPFDPYLLPRSRPLLNLPATFRTWRSRGSPPRAAG